MTAQIITSVVACFSFVTTILFIICALDLINPLVWSVSFCGTRGAVNMTLKIVRYCTRGVITIVVNSTITVVLEVLNTVVALLLFLQAHIIIVSCSTIVFLLLFYCVLFIYSLLITYGNITTYINRTINSFVANMLHTFNFYFIRCFLVEFTLCR